MIIIEESDRVAKSIFNLRLNYLTVYRHRAGQMGRLTLWRWLLTVRRMALAGHVMTGGHVERSVGGGRRRRIQRNGHHPLPTRLTRRRHVVQLRTGILLAIKLAIQHANWHLGRIQRTVGHQVDSLRHAWLGIGISLLHTVIPGRCTHSAAVLGAWVLLRCS